MGHKNQFNGQLNFQSTDPSLTLSPQYKEAPSTPLSGVTSGSMSSTNTIYSQIINVKLMDISGYDVDWAGTPTGTLSVMVSANGLKFHALTFNPVLTQPAGSAGGYYVNVEAMGFKYLMFQYTNSSGSGSLTVGYEMKDWN